MKRKRPHNFTIGKGMDFEPEELEKLLKGNALSPEEVVKGLNELIRSTDRDDVKFKAYEMVMWFQSQCEQARAVRERKTQGQKNPYTHLTDEELKRRFRAVTT